MKRSTLKLLCCPRCHGALSLRDERNDVTVDEGRLCCSDCGRSFLVKNGIARFIDLREVEGLNRRFARIYDQASCICSLFTKMAFAVFGGERKARKEILDRLELNGGRILEVSIGTGANLPYLFESPTVGEVYGLDISAGQLTRCSSFVSERGWSVELFLGTAEALPFKARSFDSVFHIGGINFFSGKKEAIGEMIRVARPGSKIVIADETERVAQLLHRIPWLSRLSQEEKVDVDVPIHLVPDTMEETRVEGIWKAHGQYHGYCLEFRKPT